MKTGGTAMKTDSRRIETARLICPGCASIRIRPFLALSTGVEYRCRDCGRRWTIQLTTRGDE